MLKMFLSHILKASILLAIISSTICVETPVLPNMDQMEKIPFKGKPVAPCRACRSLVKSFLQAVNDTERRSFEGGDVEWEKVKLGKYENSELRFIEIQEKLCSDVGRGKDQCYNMAELHEAELEDWFFEKRMQNVDLLELLCINHLKICCPDNTYGPDCIPCPGGIEAPCGGHGKCLNGGTRDEPASCFCDAGYVGDLCDQCSKGYYQEDTPSLSCKLCDRACKSHCRGPGPKNCEVCSFGYRFIENEGCVGHFDDYKRKTLISPNWSQKGDLEDEDDDDEEDESETRSDLDESETRSDLDESEQRNAQVSDHSEL